MFLSLFKKKTLEEELDSEIGRVKEIVQEGKGRDPEDFNVRGELYHLAFQFAPNARYQDIEYAKKWIMPKEGEKSVDIAAGTGFLTKNLATWTNAVVYAVDPSATQLKNLLKRCKGLPVKTVVGSLSDESTFLKMGDDIGKIDFVTSVGGIHHVIDKDGRNCQKEMFQNVSKVLRSGGRFVAMDVGFNTPLSRHFEVSVKKHCLTGHEEKWLSPERLQGELIEGTELEYVKSEIVLVQWVFHTPHEMAMFMKALHAYDLTEEEVIDDLRTILGFEEKEGKVFLNWPLLFFHLQKK